MKKLIFIVLLLAILPGVSHANIALVQHASKDAGTTTAASLVFNSNNTVGNWIGVCIRGGNSSSQVFTVTDSQGNVYKLAKQIGFTASQVTLAIYYAENIQSGVNTVTVSMTVSGPLRFAILEYSGVLTSSSLDVAAGATGTSTSPNSGNLTTTASGELLLGAVATTNSGTFTAGSGYGIKEFVPSEPNTKLIAEDRIQAAAGTASASASISASDTWGAILATFKPGSGGGNAPSITSLSINAGTVGATITINGTNFGSTQGTSTVTFNGVQAPINSWSNTAISVIVPNGATTGNVVVTIGGLAANRVAFMVVPPTPVGVGFVQGNYFAIQSSPSRTVVTATIPYPQPQTHGDLNVVVIGWRETANHIASVTDTAGNSYSVAAPALLLSDSGQAIYYAPNIAANVSNSVTVTWSGGVLRPEIHICEYKGLATTNPLDVAVGNSATTGTLNDSGAATTTNANDVLIGSNLADSNTTAAGANYTTEVLTTPGFDIYEDRITTATGSYHATATTSNSANWIAQMVAFKELPNQPPVVNAGPNQTITLPTNTVTLSGTATDDGLPNNTLNISWSQVSGPVGVTFNSPNTAVTQATFPGVGTYVLQLSAGDSQLTSSATTTVTVLSQTTYTVKLTPPIAGPNVVGATQTLAAVLTGTTGATTTPVIGATVQFTVTGPNATSGSATTDSTGTAKFTYTGAHSGTDTAQASYTGQNSNSANVTWLVPSQPISTTTILGQFFPSDLPPSGGPYYFDTLPSAKPLFTQYFPSIAFNPPSGVIPGNNVVNTNTSPFTDVTTDQNGNYSGTIAVQGNGYQAGAVGGPLRAFQAVFTGNYTISTAGNAIISIYVDNSFILGIGGGATRVSGPLSPSLTVTPFYQLPVMGAASTQTGGFSMTVNFPSPGTYPFELDYVECCGGNPFDPMSLVMITGQVSGSGFGPGMPPSGSILLTPTNPSSLPTGQSQSFTAFVVDASGAAILNTTVALNVAGANLLQLTAATDSTGHASFQYTGTNAGTDTVQASANNSGLGEYSNQVSMTWTVASGSGAITFVPQGWIGSPTNGAVVQGQMPITVASGVNLSSGTLTYWPLSNPSAVTTLNANTTGSGTVGTFDATLLPNGGYAIQLNAVANGTSQTSYITVTVVGDNKPGRLKSTVTEFKVPLAGIPISITRTYDSLERSQSEDFGLGWKLGTTVGLSVDSKMDVTFNFNGQRETFYFLAQPQSFYFAWILYPQYVPQPGLHGTLTSDGCSPVWVALGTFECLLTKTAYQPTTYFYTDPSGRTYTISANGQLQSIKDLNGNTLTIAPTGITSSVNGVVVPFVRDSSGRITQITDLNGNKYTYSYDTNGNLQSVQYPGLTAAETFTYAGDHSLLTDTDPRGNASTATYDSSGRLQTLTDAMNNKWSYSYNLTTNTTTTTNPDTGVVTETNDSFGKPLTVTDPLNQTTTYAYDTNESLISMTDPLTKTTTYTYDANGLQTSVTDPLQHTSTKTYNQFGGVVTATDAANTNTQTVTYDANFNPMKVTDLLNGAGTLVASAIYDQLGNLLTFTDANSNTTQFVYDAKGNPTAISDSINETMHFSYDAMDRVISQTDPNGNPATQFAYDALGRLKTKTEPLNKVTSYVYDNNGNKTSETDANNHTTSYQYDALNRASKVTFPDNTSKPYTYDFRGNKLTEVDQLGRTTNYVYDLAGQLTSVTYASGTPDAGTVSYTYDADGRQKTVKDELGNTTTYNYDAAGRVTSIQDAMSNVTNYAYDADNRKTSMTDMNQHTTSYSYDARSRLTTTTYPIVPPAAQPTTTLNAFDGMGRLLSVTDQAGNVTIRTYDAVGRQVSLKDALTNVTQYGYDANGNLVSLKDAAGRPATTYQYDALNRRIKRTLPLGQAETYTYDTVGNLATKTDFNGKKTTYSYDALNRLLSKVPDPSLSQPTVSFTYSSTGKRASMASASGSITYTYDNRDRLKSNATPQGTVSYTYDAHGNVLTITSSNTNGASMTYAYDALNRLSSVTDNRLLAQGAASGKTAYTYDGVGNVLGYSYPNTVQIAPTYDPLNRLTQISSSKSGVLASYAYTLGATGNRLSAVEQSGRTASYGYDNDYRLTSEAITSDPSGHNGTVSYTYDAVGNRLQQSSTLSGITGGTFSYDSNDRLTTDGYDGNGNTVSSGGLSYTFDFENRLAGSGGLSIVYDGDGNRVSETVAATTTKYLVDTLNPTGLPQVLDEVANGSVTRTYAYGLQRISENQLISGVWTPSFYGYDGHGNVRFLANMAGAVTDTYQYDAFGNQIASTGSTPNSYFYSGERFDSNLGFYDLRARYYRQASGRFWSRDPIEGKLCCGLSWNSYIYVKDNAVNAIDPTGLDTLDEYLAEQTNLFIQVRKTIKYYELAACLDYAELSILLLYPNLYSLPAAEIAQILGTAYNRCLASIGGLN